MVDINLLEPQPLRHPNGNIYYRKCPCCNHLTNQEYIYYNDLFYHGGGNPLPMGGEEGRAFMILWKAYPDTVRVDLTADYRMRSYKLNRFFQKHKIPLGVVRGPWGSRTHKLVKLRNP